MAGCNWVMVDSNSPHDAQNAHFVNTSADVKYTDNLSAIYDPSSEEQKSPFLFLLSYVLNGPVTSVLVVAGSGLNVLCVTLLRRNNHSAIALYLSAVACWNTVILLSAFFLYSFPTIYYGSLPYIGQYVYLYRVAFTVSNMAFVGSVWILVALVVDRYIALSNPFYHHTRIGRKGLTGKMILAVSGFAVLSGSPRFFELTVRHCQIQTLMSNGTMGSLTVPMIDLSDVGTNVYYLICYRIVGGMLTYSVVPYAVLFGLSISVLVRVQRNRHQQPITVPVGHRRYPASGGGRQNDRSTRLMMSHCRQNTTRRRQFKSDYMLMALIGKFLATNLWPTLIDVLEQTLGVKAFVASDWSSTLVDLSNLLVVTNAATNFFVYLAWNRNFRVNFQRLLSDQYRRLTVGRGDNLTDRSPSKFNRPRFTTGVSHNPPPAAVAIVSSEPTATCADSPVGVGRTPTQSMLSDAVCQPDGTPSVKRCDSVGDVARLLRPGPCDSAGGDARPQRPGGGECARLSSTRRRILQRYPALSPDVLASRNQRRLARGCSMTDNTNDSPRELLNSHCKLVIGTDVTI